MTDNNDHVYAYGIVEQEDLRLSIDGVRGAGEVYTVDYRNLSAVVSDVDTTDPERTDEDVEAHNDVLRTVMEHGDGRTVVPMSFGMAFKNERTLKGVVRGARRAFRKALNDVDGTVELGVKVVDTGAAGRDGDAVRSDVAGLLSEHALDSTDDDLFSDRLVLNRSYLVERGRRESFDGAVDEVEATVGDDYSVHYTGPWAPYNFVDIRVGAEGAR